MGAGVAKEEKAVWPPGWLDIPEVPRLIARNAILDISAESPATFLTIQHEAYLIADAEWNFDDYHAAAAAAVQEDIKLNRLTYCLVPKRLSEGEVWRLYFSKVLHILDSVKVHGTYPPPKAVEPPAAAAPAPAVDAPSDSSGSSCLLQ